MVDLQRGKLPAARQGHGAAGAAFRRRARGPRTTSGRLHTAPGAKKPANRQGQRPGKRRWRRHQARPTPQPARDQQRRPTARRPACCRRRHARRPSPPRAGRGPGIPAWAPDGSPRSTSPTAAPVRSRSSAPTRIAGSGTVTSHRQPGARRDVTVQPGSSRSCSAPQPPTSCSARAARTCSKYPPAT